MSSIAKKYGYGDWKSIYDHSRNAAFKQKRPNPNHIFPGDQVFIPDKTRKQSECATEKTNTFRWKSTPTFFRLVLQDDKGELLSGKKYQLKVGDRVFTGTTGDDGLVEHKIPADKEEGELTVWLDDNSQDGYKWPLKIGHLDPVEEITGVQARLENLGFECGSVDGVLGPATQDALRAFQAQMGLEPTGEIDEETRKKLSEGHDAE